MDAEIKTEAAEAMMVSRAGIDRVLWIVREYEPEVLARWLKKHFSFHHIETANRLYTLSQYDSPAELLDAAIEAGGGEGKPMTVAELESFALGHQPQIERNVKLNGLFLSVLKISSRAALLMGWDVDKREEFEAELSELWKRYF
jgi:hypothetical protein